MKDATKLKLCIFGASGRTGLCLVHNAISHGHLVTAFCRNASSRAVLPKSEIRVQIGSLLEADDVQQAITGVDAVVCVFGPRPPYTDIFCAEATGTIIKAMSTLGVKRLVCLTGAMIGDYPKQRSFSVRLMVRLYRRQKPELAADRAQQERLVTDSGLEWSVVKPPRLTNGPAKGKFQVGEHLKIGLLSSISRADLATCLITAVESNLYLRQRIFVRY